MKGPKALLALGTALGSLGAGVAHAEPALKPAGAPAIVLSAAEPVVRLVPFARYMGTTSDDVAAALGLEPARPSPPARYAFVSFTFARGDGGTDGSAVPPRHSLALDKGDGDAVLLALRNARITAEETRWLQAPTGPTVALLARDGSVPTPNMRAEDNEIAAVPPVVLAEPSADPARSAISPTIIAQAVVGDAAVAVDGTEPPDAASAFAGDVAALGAVPGPKLRPEVEALVLAPSSEVSVTPEERAGLAEPSVAVGAPTVASSAPSVAAASVFPTFTRPERAAPDANVELAAYPALTSLRPLTSLDIRLPKTTPRERHTRQICGLIEREAARVGMPAPFFARLINKESRFDPGAISPVGAQGVAQFMPYTARERGLRDPFEPVEAIPASADYLADLKAMLGNWGLAAAGYNAGPGRVIDFFEGRNLPYETRDYVLSITGMPATHFTTLANEVENKPLDASLSFLDACQKLPTMRFKRPLVAGGDAAWQPWGVQLSASFVRASAVASFERQVKRYGTVLGGKRPMVIRDKVPGLRRSKFAARVGAPSRKAADALCGKLRRAGGRCMVMKNKR